MSDWKDATLDTICTLMSGGTPSKENKNYWGGEYLWISARDLKHLIIKNASRTLTEEGIQSGTRVAPLGSVLILVRGMTLLKDLPVGYLVQNAAFNQDIKALIPSEELSGLFLAYALIARKSQILHMVDRAGHGTGRLDTELLKKFTISYPSSLDEQKAIVRFLSTWDRAIELTTQLITAKQQRKRGLMQQLLTGKMRFPMFKDQWKIVMIGDLLSESRIHGSTGRTAYKITVKLYGKGVVPQKERGVGSEATRYFQRHAGQFIYSKLDFLNGAFGVIPSEMDGYESTLDLPCFDFKGSLIPEFFLYFVSRESFYSRFTSFALGGRKARRIQVDEFLSSEIEIPGMEEQANIVAILSNCDQELTLLNRKLALLKRQKQGLMQQLLTGRVRVTDDQHAVVPRGVDLAASCTPVADNA